MGGWLSALTDAANGPAADRQGRRTFSRRYGALPDDDERRRAPAGPGVVRRDGPLRGGAQQGGRAARDRRARPGRHACHGGRRQDHHDRRAIHRDEGDDRQLRADRRAVQGGGDRAVPALLGDRAGRRGRHAPGLRPRAVTRPGTVRTEASHAAVEAVWRLESARIIASLARLVRDVGLAEEVAQDALVAALEQWPRSGVPENPGAWLMLAAKHRAIDRLRRNDRLTSKLAEL